MPYPPGAQYRQHYQRQSHPAVRTTQLYRDENIPARLRRPQDGFDVDNQLQCDVPHYFMLMDLESSGPIFTVNQVLAVAVAIVSVTFRGSDNHWVVRVHELCLFSFPQDQAVFAEDLVRPGGFWYEHNDTLVQLRRHAEQHGHSMEEVTRDMAAYIDRWMQEYDYPNIYSDHIEFDIAHINVLYGMYLKRPALSCVYVPHAACYHFARRAYCMRTIALDLIDPCKTNMDDISGTPNLCNTALSQQGMRRLDGLRIDHNPANDVHKMAVDFGRIYARRFDLRMNWGIHPIVCYAYDSQEPLREMPRTSRRHRYHKERRRPEDQEQPCESSVSTSSSYESTERSCMIPDTAADADDPVSSVTAKKRRRSRQRKYR